MTTKKEKAKTGMAKIVTNGNCCICGKPLDSGLFLCKKCASHIENRREMNENSDAETDGLQ